jgi:succinate dehydrogenase/fumarate reductase flavoprotein subunit
MSSELQKNNGISRRNFVKGAVVAAGSGILVGCSPQKTEENNIAPQNQSAQSDLMTVEKAAQKWSFEIPPNPIADNEISETRETEIVVVGAGPSGIITALSASEAGGKVICFASGKGPIGRGGSNFAVYSKYMESLGLSKLEAEPFIRNQIMSNSFNIDSDKWYHWYNNSEEATNWVIDHMAKTSYELCMEQGNRNMDPADPAYAPSGTHAWISADMKKAGDGEPFVVQSLEAQAKEAGAEFIYQVTAQQLVRENNNTGRVTAVIGKTADGKYIKFKASKAIVLATGDFSADAEMMTKYCPQALQYVKNIGAKDFDPENGKVYGGLYTGQGQKMGLWVGAAWQKAYPNAPMILVLGGSNNLPYNLPSGLIVNKNGTRFFDEEISGGFMYNLLQHQPGGVFFNIWDAGYAETGQPWYLQKTVYGSDPATPEAMLSSWEDGVKNKSVIKSDTLEDLVKQMGLPDSTVEEIKKYNGFCTDGKDTDFYKNPNLLKPIEKGPFYGSSGRLIFLTVMGGLRTNINMQVCADDDSPIPGLYNVGTMVGDMFASCYSFQIAGHNIGMNCNTFGYLTGKYIVKNE